MLEHKIIYSKIFGDYVIHKDTGYGLLALGANGVGKSFLVSKLLGMNKDFVVDPSSPWKFGASDSSYVKRYGDKHFVGAENFRCALWMRTPETYDTSQMTGVFSDKEAVRGSELKKVLFLLKEGSDFTFEKYLSGFGKPEEIEILTDFKRYDLLSKIKFSSEQRVAVFDQLVDEVTSEFSELKNPLISGSTLDARIQHYRNITFALQSVRGVKNVKLEAGCVVSPLKYSLFLRYLIEPKRKRKQLLLGIDVPVPSMKKVMKRLNNKLDVKIPFSNYDTHLCAQQEFNHPILINGVPYSKFEDSIYVFANQISDVEKLWYAEPDLIPFEIRDLISSCNRD